MSRSRRLSDRSKQTLLLSSKNVGKVINQFPRGFDDKFQQYGIEDLLNKCSCFVVTTAPGNPGKDGHA